MLLFFVYFISFSVVCFVVLVADFLCFLVRFLIFVSSLIEKKNTFALEKHRQKTTSQFMLYSLVDNDEVDYIQPSSRRGPLNQVSNSQREFKWQRGATSDTYSSHSVDTMVRRYDGNT